MMMTNTSDSPLITVIIPTYNRSNILPYSVGSALNQTYQNIEILVIGDGCTDDSQVVIEGMSDDRVRWIGLPNNSGHQSTPNNVGIQEAKGEYIAYLGHDDLWLPHHLQACSEALNQGLDLAYGIFLLIWPDKKGLVAPETPTTPATVVHRKSVIDTVGGWKYHRSIVLPPDLDLWYRIHRAGLQCGLVPRLSTIKIQAAFRKDVYKIRPSDEQEFWFNRISNEPDLEAKEVPEDYLDRMSCRTGIEFSEDFQDSFNSWAKGEKIESLRLYKGLD